MKFSIKDFFSKCDQIRWKLGIWSHLLKKSLMENFIFRAVIEQKVWFTDQMKWRGSIESSMAVINKKSIQCNNIIIGVKIFFSKYWKYWMYWKYWKATMNALYVQDRTHTSTRARNHYYFKNLLWDILLLYRCWLCILSR